MRLLVTPQRTADKRLVAPTPIIAPVIHYSCQWTPSCMYLLCSFSVPEINSASNKKGVSELFLTHLFIYTNSANLTSLPQNQHPEHCHHACYYPDQHSDLHSYQDQPVRHPEFRLERTFQHLQPGKQY